MCLRQKTLAWTREAVPGLPESECEEMQVLPNRRGGMPIQVWKLVEKHRRGEDERTAKARAADTAGGLFRRDGIMTRMVRKNWYYF